MLSAFSSDAAAVCLSEEADESDCCWAPLTEPVFSEFEQPVNPAAITALMIMAINFVDFIFKLFIFLLL